MPAQYHIDEPRWTGTRQILIMSAPIVLGMISHAVMEFFDKWMVAQVSTEAFAAVGSAGIWSYTLATLFLGVIGCVGTFVAQSFGKGNLQHCAHYAWQGIHLSLPLGILAVAMIPLSRPLFDLMGHDPGVTEQELVYFRIRLIGYFALGWSTALAAFFQAVNRSWIPMLTSTTGILLNILLNYLLIFGHGGFPRLGIAGAAIATVTSQCVQVILLHGVFIASPFHRAYNTRHTWRLDYHRAKELVTIGVPAGMGSFLDIAMWSIFTSFLVGRFGTVSLAAHNAAMVFLHICFMPALGLHQGIAAIVGQWIGAGDIPRAKARTVTAIKLAMAHMVPSGLLLGVFGGKLIAWGFSDDPNVIRMGHQLLILAAIFQAFDAVNIIGLGALRGAGDTRWTMFAMFFGAYIIFLPLAIFVACVLGLGAVGAWIGATIYIIGLSFVIYRRFMGERWRHINIFSESQPTQAA